jgi:hypothetical protein
MAKAKVRFNVLKLRGNTSVKKKRIRQANGQTRSINVVDTESPTFILDLSAVFAKNVATARRANSGLPARAYWPDFDKLSVERSLLQRGAHIAARKKKKKPSKTQTKKT